jgi:hypothetical protein
MGQDYPNLITPDAKAAAQKIGLGEVVSRFSSGGQIGKPGSGTAPQAKKYDFSNPNNFPKAQ